MKVLTETEAQGMVSVHARVRAMWLCRALVMSLSLDAQQDPVGTKSKTTTML